MKVLIAEDEPISLHILESTLRKWRYDVVVTRDGNQAWEILQRDDAPPLAILDWMMPGMNGLELCSKIRTASNTKYIYTILLTSKGSKEDIIAGLESGADDYIVKPFVPEELRWRVHIGQRIIDLEERLRKLASIDYLTGVLNRRSLMERLEAEFNRSRRENTPLSVIMADIDFFKSVNDRFGHHAGDLVLQEFARCLIKGSRSYDFIGRFGGEEFVVCCPGAANQQALSIAERMREMVESLTIFSPECKESIRITASFGVAWEHENDPLVDSIIQRADEALYRAKKEGRNRVWPPIPAP